MPLEALHLGLRLFLRTEEQECIFQKSVEQTNLAAKKALIEKINTIDEADHDEALAALKGIYDRMEHDRPCPF